jgi:hypothetical protein
MDWQAIDKRIRAFFGGRLPSWPYLIAAVAVWAIARWIGSIEILEPLRRVTESFLADLQVLSPLNVFGAYYYKLTGCAVVYEGSSITASCDSDVFQTMKTYGISGWLILAWPGVVLWETAATVWDNSGWLGRIIYLLTLPIGVFAAREAVIATGDNMKRFNGERIPEDWTIFGWSAFVALVPAFASLAALLLQWLLIVIAWVFGMALGWIVWLIAIIAGPLAWVRGAMSIVKSAQDLEKGHNVLSGSGDAGVPTETKKSE